MLFKYLNIMYQDFVKKFSFDNINLNRHYEFCVWVAEEILTPEIKINK